jgi:hypothetical protein
MLDLKLFYFDFIICAFKMKNGLTLEFAELPGIFVDVGMAMSFVFQVDYLVAQCFSMAAVSRDCPYQILK